MIHPNTCLRFISEDMGYGLFATAFIPKGTIVYVKDALEIELSPETYLAHSTAMQEVIEKYSYIDERGFRILSWDTAKYVNHCCQCNTMSTGYGFEVAIRDIQPGEEITDEYGLFNLEYEMPLACAKKGCRGMIRVEDPEKLADRWDEQVRAALDVLFDHPQPLMNLLDDATVEDLVDFVQDEGAYRSVRALRYPQRALHPFG